VLGLVSMLMDVSSEMIHAVLPLYLVATLRRGLRQSLDTIGAVLGPALALVVMALTADSFQTVFWIAVVPAGP
jgi:hypothetical protein